MSRAAAVTGMGLLTPAGTGARALWECLCRAESTAAHDPALAGMPVDFSCRVPDFDPAGLRNIAWRTNRFIQLAVAAARMAVTDSGLAPGGWDAPRVGVVMGVGTAGMEHWPGEAEKLLHGRLRAVSPLALPRSIPNMAAGEIALDLGVTGPNLSVSTACASGATALGVAKDLLASGRCDVVLAGGAESPRASQMAAVCFARMSVLSRGRHGPSGASRPFDADRDGFVLGEGAAVLVLESAEHARGRRAAVRAWLSGYGASADAHHPTTPDPRGGGASAAIGAALAEAGLRPCDIDHVNAHGSSTELNDLYEARALCRIFAEPPPVTANKGSLGHGIGAAGAIEAACAVLTLQHQLLPPVANFTRLDPRIDLDVVAGTPRRRTVRAVLSNSFGFGGQNAALVLTRA
ncbi:beta-ketoacyl-[acyl-carrier-protein] synthase family protein [Streptomyces sp. LP05-1]|uniref:Beta-ketoacyl-[acyl-carrier-protein] synthase family protein n=1 Tax=Streptomyces pyxinae TaxID=2970734 RepID=A0ABT2CH00_9ACTN|nr:beta-ketoacyl-[acyl-carrier-protein] synthase family protein [Streptomyces sp. LP05-1]MCS0636689.1 beta-ketoacyl-[acyl-carrier-protein] synthase family protein [Streptomyces sp. LP05-1]